MVWSTSVLQVISLLWLFYCRWDFLWTTEEMFITLPVFRSSPFR